MKTHAGRKNRRLVKLLIVVGFIGLMIIGFRLASSRQPLLRNETWFSRFESPGRTSGVKIEPTKNESGVAEVEYNSQIKLDESLAPGTVSEDSLLPADRPDWVATPDDISSEVHRICVSSELESSLIAARATLDSSLVDHVRNYIDRSRPANAKPIAAKLDRLDSDWIKKNLAVNAPEYEVEL